eukprot:jgi/Bigna1/76748/fgenesh1_pg.43_\
MPPKTDPKPFRASSGPGKSGSFNLLEILFDPRNPSGAQAEPKNIVFSPTEPIGIHKSRRTRFEPARASFPQPARTLSGWRGGGDEQSICIPLYGSTGVFRCVEGKGGICNQRKRKEGGNKADIPPLVPEMTMYSKWDGLEIAGLHLATSVQTTSDDKEETQKASAKSEKEMRIPDGMRIKKGDGEELIQAVQARDLRRSIRLLEERPSIVAEVAAGNTDLIDAIRSHPDIEKAFRKVSKNLGNGTFGETFLRAHQILQHVNIEEDARRSNFSGVWVLNLYREDSTLVGTYIMDLSCERESGRVAGVGVMEGFEVDWRGIFDGRTLDCKLRRKNQRSLPTALRAKWKAENATFEGRWREPVEILSGDEATRKEGQGRAGRIVMFKGHTGLVAQAHIMLQRANDIGDNDSRMYHAYPSPVAFTPRILAWASTEHRWEAALLFITRRLNLTASAWERLWEDALDCVGVEGGGEDSIAAVAAKNRLPFWTDVDEQSAKSSKLVEIFLPRPLPIHTEVAFRISCCQAQGYREAAEKRLRELTHMKKRLIEREQLSLVLRLSKAPQKILIHGVVNQSLQTQIGNVQKDKDRIEEYRRILNKREKNLRAAEEELEEGRRRMEAEKAQLRHYADSQLPLNETADQISNLQLLHDGTNGRRCAQKPTPSTWCWEDWLASLPGDQRDAMLCFVDGEIPTLQDLVLIGYEVLLIRLYYRFKSQCDFPKKLSSSPFLN